MADRAAAAAALAASPAMPVLCGLLRHANISVVLQAAGSVQDIIRQSTPAYLREQPELVQALAALCKSPHAAAVELAVAMLDSLAGMGLEDMVAAGGGGVNVLASRLRGAAPDGVAAACIHLGTLALHPKLRGRIAEAGAIPLLVNRLKSPDERASPPSAPPGPLATRRRHCPELAAASRRHRCWRSCSLPSPPAARS